MTLLLVVPATASTVCWVSYLIFCAWLVKRTGDASDLNHAATVARAFRRETPCVQCNGRLGHSRSQPSGSKPSLPSQPLSPQ